MSGALVAASEALHRRVRAAIDGEPLDAHAFDEIARAVAAFQIEHVEAVGRRARARGFDASRDAIDALPALPVDALRLRRVAAHPAALDVRVFRTSGTTQGSERRGEHAFRTLATYEAAALAWGPRHLWPHGAPARVLALAPPSDAVPDSSLSFMIDLFARHLGVPIDHFVDPERGLALAPLEAALAEAPAARGPWLVCGTAFAYVYLLDALDGRSVPLPSGSSVMITGGFKGRSREVPEGELRFGLARAFGVASHQIVGEYGMTELSSQLWDPGWVRGARPTPAVYLPPPWVRVSAADPETLEALPAGEVGVARIVDLANVDSAIALQTSDRVRVTEAGVELFGRAPGAPPRGCSLAIEELGATP